MGKTRDLFQKIRDTKGTFHAKMGTTEDRNGMDLTEAEDIKMRWQNTQKIKVKVSQSCPALCKPLAACQFLLSMEFFGLEYWSGQSFSSSGDLPNLGIEARSPALQVDSLPAEPQGKEAQEYWSGQPNPSPMHLPDPGLELGSPALQADSLSTDLAGKPAL